MNPSYDTFMEWHNFGLKSDDVEISELLKMRHGSKKQLNKIQKLMICKMKTHNESIEEEKEKLSQLIHLPKRPYGNNF